MFLTKSSLGDVYHNRQLLGNVSHKVGCWVRYCTYGIIRYHTVPYTVSYGIIRYDMVPYIRYHMISYGIIWHHVVSYIRYHAYGIIWYLVVSYGVIWYHTVSYGIIAILVHLVKLSFLLQIRFVGRVCYTALPLASTMVQALVSTIA